MMEPSEYIQAWMLAVAAFNEGNLEPLADRLAENCDWADVGSSRDEIMQVIKSQRDEGWVRHDVLSIATEGSAMVGIAKNTMADGTSALVSGCFQMDADGRIEKLRHIDHL
jgi:hypothetical protein